MENKGIGKNFNKKILPPTTVLHNAYGSFEKQYVCISFVPDKRAGRFSEIRNCARPQPLAVILADSTIRMERFKM